MNIEFEELSFMGVLGEIKPYGDYLEVTDSVVFDKHYRNLFFIMDRPYSKEIISNMISERRKQGQDFACFFISGSNFNRTFFPISKEVKIEHNCYLYHSIDELAMRDTKGQKYVVEKNNISEFLDFYQSLFGEEDEGYLKREMKAIKTSIKKDERIHYYVIRYHSKIIGMIQLFVNLDVARVEDFEIKKEYQRKGYGSSLLSFALKEARKMGAKTIFLVADMDDTSIEMYKKMGFKELQDVYFLYCPLK